MGAVRQLEIVTRKSTGPLDSPLGARLRRIEARIAGNEISSLEARWEFGRELLDQRQGKILPKGLAAEVMKEHNIGRREISYRMQFAAKYPTREQLGDVSHTYRTWYRIQHEALPKKSRTAKKNSFEERMTDRVTRMINEAKTTRDKNLLAQILADAAQQLTIKDAK